MTRWIMGSSLKSRFLVVVLAGVLMAFGIAQLRNMPVDVTAQHSQTSVKEFEDFKPATVAPPAQPGDTMPNFKVAFIADQGLTSNSRAVLNLVKSEGAHMVIHSGDFGYSDNPDAWDRQINDILGPNYPYFASIGNHDLSAWSGYQAKLHARLARIPEATCAGDLGTKSACYYKGLFFILVGPGMISSGHDLYIRDQLAADKSTWSVCSWHYNQNAMQVGGKEDKAGWDVYEECRKGGAIVATGHEHSYARTKTLTSTPLQIVDPNHPDPNNLFVSPGSTFVFHSGLGGRSIRDQERCLPSTYPYGCQREWAFIYTANQGARYGALFISFHVDGDPKKATGYFKNINGQVVESFVVRTDSALR